MLVEGTVYWDNHRIYVSLFAKYVTRGCATAAADPETEVSDEETEETSNASTLMRPEDARWVKLYLVLQVKLMKVMLHAQKLHNVCTHNNMYARAGGIFLA